MIEASQRMIAVNSQLGGEASEGWGINPVMKRHFELKIKTLQNAPRDADKLGRLLKSNKRQKEKSANFYTMPLLCRYRKKSKTKKFFSDLGMGV